VYDDDWTNLLPIKQSVHVFVCLFIYLFIVGSAILLKAHKPLNVATSNIRIRS